jgi:hypothetical protein
MTVAIEHGCNAEAALTVAKPTALVVYERPVTALAIYDPALAAPVRLPVRTHVIRLADFANREVADADLPQVDRCLKGQRPYRNFQEWCWENQAQLLMPDEPDDMNAAPDPEREPEPSPAEELVAQAERRVKARGEAFCEYVRQQA